MHKWTTIYPFFVGSSTFGNLATRIYYPRTQKGQLLRITLRICGRKRPSDHNNITIPRIPIDLASRKFRHHILTCGQQRRTTFMFAITYGSPVLALSVSVPSVGSCTNKTKESIYDASLHYVASLYNKKQQLQYEYKKEREKGGEKKKTTRAVVCRLPRPVKFSQKNICRCHKTVSHSFR